MHIDLQGLWGVSIYTIVGRVSPIYHGNVGSFSCCCDLLYVGGTCIYDYSW